MATSTSSVSGDYRVTSINEAGADRVNVNFVEVVAENNTSGYVGNFSRTFSVADGAEYFPGQVYTMTLTKKS